MALSTPGYAPRQKVTTTVTPAPAPSFTTPADPHNIRGRMSPGALAQESSLISRGQRISQGSQAARASAITGARAGLKGIGGYSVGDDGNVTYDPNAEPGERQRQAVRGERSAANAVGLGSSSFAAKNIGVALGRLSQEAQQVVTQLAGSFNEIAQAELDAYDDISTSLLGLWGGEAQRIMDELPIPADTPDGPPGGTAVQDEIARRRADEDRQRAAAAKKKPQVQTAVSPGQVLWTGVGEPNMATLRAANPGIQLKRVRDPKTKKWIVKAA